MRLGNEARQNTGGASPAGTNDRRSGEQGWAAVQQDADRQPEDPTAPGQAPATGQASAPGTDPDTGQVPVSEQRPTRTGRNLPAAIAVGVLLGGLALLTLFTVKATFLLYVGIILALALWELSHALRIPRDPPAAGPDRGRRCGDGHAGVLDAGRSWALGALALAAIGVLGLAAAGRRRRLRPRRHRRHVHAAVPAAGGGVRRAHAA